VKIIQIAASSGQNAREHFIPVLFALTDSGEIFYTFNRGDRWERVPLPDAKTIAED